jgi:hypothetical protein
VRIGGKCAGKSQVSSAFKTHQLLLLLIQTNIQYCPRSAALSPFAISPDALLPELLLAWPLTAALTL